MDETPARRYLGSTTRYSGESTCAIVADVPTQTRKVSTEKQSENNTLVDLIRLIDNKDKKAFETFYDTTIKRSFSLALRITLKNDIAEEVIGDLYMQVWRKSSSYNASRSDVMTWLLMMCRSRALDALRQRKGLINESVSLEAIAEPVTNENPQDLLQATLQGSELHAAINQLKQQERQMLSLAYFRGYTHAEMAEYTGIPVGTVKTQIRRATIALKKIMLDMNTQGGGSYE